MRVFLFLLLGSLSAHAYNGAISSATADAGRASVEASESPFLNPAGLPFLRGYYFTSSFATSPQGKTQTDQDVALSVTDNLPQTVVPTSFAYTQTHLSDLTTSFPGAEIYNKDFRLSVGSFAFKHWTAGVGIHYDQTDLVRSNQQDIRYTQTNFQLATLWAPTLDLGFTLIEDNLLPRSSDVPDELRLKPTTAFGVNYNYRTFMRLKADIITASNNSLNKPVLAAGLESYANKWLVLRMGLQRNNEENANIYAVGVGFVGPKFGLHYAYQNSPDQDTLTRHSVDLALPLW